MKQFIHVQPTLRLARGILIASLLAGTSAAGNELPASSGATQAPVQASTAAVAPANSKFEVGILQVERQGERGTPVILIPGLASGAWVWEDTVRRLQNTHVVYVVTLPGFSGRPAQTGAGMPEALASLQQLIVVRKLERPVVIGHILVGSALDLTLTAVRDVRPA